MNKRCERSISPGEVVVFAYLEDGLVSLRGRLLDGDQAVGRALSIEIDADLVDPRFGEGPTKLMAHREDRWQVLIERHLDDSGCPREFDGGIGPVHVQQLDAHFDRLPSVAALHFDLDEQVEDFLDGKLLIPEAFPETNERDLASTRVQIVLSEQDGETAHVVSPARTLQEEGDSQ